MSHFYGTLKGSRGESTRAGTKSSGYVATAAGWRGAVRVELTHNAFTGKDEYTVTLTPWQSSGGATRTLAQGVLDATTVQS